MESTQLKIGGMSCQMCVGHVTKALQSVSGVREVKVDLSTESAQVQHEGASTQAMIEAVIEDGYEAEVSW